MVEIIYDIDRFNEANVHCSLAAIDVGFDVRPLGMAVEMPAGEPGSPLAVKCDSPDGRSAVVRGPYEEVLEQLRQWAMN